MNTSPNEADYEAAHLLAGHSSACLASMSLVGTDCLCFAKERTERIASALARARSEGHAAGVREECERWRSFADERNPRSLLPEISTKAGRAEYARKLLQRLNTSGPDATVLESALEYLAGDAAAGRVYAHAAGVRVGLRRAVLVNGSTPYPLLDVLRILCDVADHALTAHSCDHHGYEVWGEARDAGRECIRELTRLATEGGDLEAPAGAERTYEDGVRVGREEAARVVDGWGPTMRPIAREIRALP